MKAICKTWLYPVSYTHLDVYKRQVVGFDDVEYATMMNPMLTTVSQPLYPLGKTSARMLIDQIESGEGKGKIFLEHKLVIRDSTARLEP